MVAVAAVVVGTPVARGAASSGGARLAGPVVVYMVVISAMVVSAVAAGPWLAGAGAVLFFVSDGLIAWNRFVAPLRRAPVAIMVTYHLGQAGLVLPGHLSRRPPSAGRPRVAARRRARHGVGVRERDAMAAGALASRYRDRDDAGRQLAAQLSSLRSEQPLVLGLPRGGMIVAAAVAAELGAGLDVLVVRKLGVPSQPELAMGAVGE